MPLYRQASDDDLRDIIDKATRALTQDSLRRFQYRLGSGISAMRAPRQTARNLNI